jgi:exonuclease VII large subunit
MTKISGGFGYIEGEDKYAVKSINDIKIGENIRVVLSDGSFEAVVSGTEKQRLKI